MKKTIPSFSEILESNKLINGKLILSEEELKKLYFNLLKNDKLFHDKILKQESIIKKHTIRRNEINHDLKRNYETLLKTFHPESNKISLLYKKQASSNYIKARFYWDGKQREVQIGTIPIVISMINNLIKNKNLLDTQLIKHKNYSWESIIKNKEMVISIKAVASIKAQDYIIRKLISRDKDSKSIKNDTIKAHKSKVSQNPELIESVKTKDKLTDVNWYEEWRERNL